ncbi:MAG: 2-amino-4-hydroxy-6-hydroxymethyldihydropteridine diphosphokinase [bacterium]
MAHLVYLSLGSNMGDREEYLRQAVARLKSITGLNVIAESSIIETEPWGMTDQPAFLNMAVAMRTSFAPFVVLQIMQKMEELAGREHLEKWGPRTLDIDILTYDDIELNFPQLTLPHPHLTERLFVLQPLAEIAPELVVKGKTVREWLELVRLGEEADSK